MYPLSCQVLYHCSVETILILQENLFDLLLELGGPVSRWMFSVSPAIPLAVRYAGFVLSSFTVRPDGRIPFQYLLRTPYVSPLCMFGESVFALIPDHEVRVAKLTNRWISGCWWGRDASSDEHLVGTKFGVPKCRPVRRKPPGEQWSRRETVEARGEMELRRCCGHWNRDEEMTSATSQREIPTVPPPEPGRQAPEPRRTREWMRKPCETPKPGKSHARECKAHQDMWEESRQTVRAEEAKRGVVQDADSRPLNPSSSSTDQKPRTTADDTENTLDRMDVNSVLKDTGNISSSGTCK